MLLVLGARLLLQPEEEIHFRVERISFSKMKMLFPKWNYGYKILQRLEAWSILDWGQGEKVSNETCSPKKGGVFKHILYFGENFVRI